MRTLLSILLPIAALGLLAPACTTYTCREEDHTICRDAVTYWVDSCGNEGAVAEACICGCDPLGEACRLECGCQPDCSDRVCGPDGCGRQCPPGCGDTQVCSYWGVCVGEDCLDEDGDGYGRGAACLDPDCDDKSRYVYPGAPETCEDGIDQDCDGADISCNALCNSPTLDCSQAGLSIQGRDADGDLWGECCDCDETDPQVHPKRTEILYNGKDDDCDESTPDNPTLTDADHDGFESLASGGADCDDQDPEINPGAVELCNGRDDNCDGRTDEGCYVDGGPDADGGVDGGAVDGGDRKD